MSNSHPHPTGAVTRAGYTFTLIIASSLIETGDSAFRVVSVSYTLPIKFANGTIFSFVCLLERLAGTS
jgi:hypothetical protein